MSREMKDSGDKAIGTVPCDWNISPLKHSITYNDESLSEKTDPDYKFRYIEIGAVTIENGVSEYGKYTFREAPSRARRIVKNDDVIISTVRTYLRAITVIKDDEDVIASTGFAVLRPKSIVPGYLGYVLKSNSFIENVIANSYGVSYPAINSSDLVRLHIPLPQEKEQRQIVSFLDRKCSAIDTAIEKTKKSIEKLEEYKKAVITKAVTKGLEPDAKMKDSGVEWIGEVPEMWDVLPIKRKYNIVSGATPKSDKPAFWDGDIPWITPSDYKTEDVFVSDGKKSITREGYNSCSTTLVPEGSVIFSKRAPVGTVAISSNELCTNQGCLSCVPCKDILPKFGYYTILSGKEIFEIAALGTTFMEISADAFANFKLPYCSLSEQHQIVDYLDNKCASIGALIVKKQEAISKWEEYKKSLIYYAVTGKIDCRGENL